MLRDFDAFCEKSGGFYMKLERCGLDHVDLLTQTMMRAFRKDPFYECVLSSPAIWEKGGWALFHYMVRLGVLYGRAEAVSGKCEAAAVWFPASGVPEPAWYQRRAGVLRARLRLGREAMGRYESMNDQVVSLQKEFAPFPHWYLFLLAVDPDKQGEGLGRRLLESGLSRLDASGMPCYLETFRSDTAAMYQKFGFRTLREQQLSEGNLRIHCMLRSPQ
jgi:GNAT superfamily N-acetyltransferase